MWLQVAQEPRGTVLLWKAWLFQGLALPPSFSLFRTLPSELEQE